MSTQSPSYPIRFLSLISGLLVLATFAPATTVHALPPRPTPVPPTPPGAYIKLDLTGSKLTDWIVVEWQDGRGGWNLVEGWQGNPDEGEKVWWVSPEHFGLGPFRWRVYDKRGGKLLGTSPAYYLPKTDNEYIRSEVKLPTH